MRENSATVFIVDDDREVCRAIGRLLRVAEYETRTFSSAGEFLASHDSASAGCIVLDLTMPGMDGLELQASLMAAGCRRPIIFLTGNGSIASSVAALRGGAVNFLTKPIEDHELFAAVEEALRVDAAERKRAALRHAAAERLEMLTPRERQVLEQVVQGRLNKQIAAELGIVEKTIKVHRGRVMQKMGARSLAELVLLASAVGIVADFTPRAAQRADTARRLDQGPIVA